MRPATLSILGLYKYDATLFDDFQIPEALDKDLLIDNLLSECAELEVVYADGEFLKFLIGRWSKKCLPVWTKLYNTTVLEYDPIENYNRYEEWEETGKETGTETGTDTTTDTGKETGTGSGSSSGSGTSDTTNSGTSIVSNVAFNSDVFKDATKQTDNANSTSENTSSSQMSTEYQTDTAKSSTLSRDMSSGRDNKLTHSGHIHGNIGVTTSQQMIQSEREVALYNIYDVIIADFKSKFCIGIY